MTGIGKALGPVRVESGQFSHALSRRLRAAYCSMLRHMVAQAVSVQGTVPRLAYSIAESEALSGLSRSSLYRLIAAGQLKTVQRGRRRLVPSAELERLCSEQSP